MELNRDVRDLQALVRPLNWTGALVVAIMDDIWCVVRLETGWLERRLGGWDDVSQIHFLPGT